MEGIEQLVSDFKKAFHSCDNDLMFKIHSEFLSRVQQKPKVKRSLDFSEYIRYKSELEYFDQVWEYLEADDWTIVTESNEIKVQARGSGSEFFTKCEVIIHQDLFKTLAVLSAVDLVTSWVSVVTRLDILSEPTMTRKLTKFHFWFPWPLANRQCIIEFNAFPIAKEKACLITMKTPESENYMGIKIPAFEADEVRMWVRLGCLYAKMIDESTTKVTFLVSADGNIAYLPTTLVNYGMKHIMYYVMDELRNKIHAFEGSPYQTRLQEKPELFEYMRKAISDYCTD